MTIHASHAPHTDPHAGPANQATPQTPDEAPARTMAPASADSAGANSGAASGKPVEVGGPKGPEPTRYNDWERNGRCSDF